MSNKKRRRHEDVVRLVDNLCVPNSFEKQKDRAAYIAEIAPPSEMCDYLLFTDGSGHHDGFGAYAALLWRISDQKSILRAGSTYGSTVQRTEMTAFLDGLHAAVSDWMDLRNLSEPPSGGDRPIVKWFTDRLTAAMPLIRTSDGNAAMRMKSDKDLWMRYIYLSRYAAVIPILIERNGVDGQAYCDSMCRILRSGMKEMKSKIESLENPYYDGWERPQPQKALL